MKLYYDKKLKNPTYYVQIGIRNGKKVTTKNIYKFGKHSELLKEHKDPLSFVKEEIKKMNDDKENKKIELIINAAEQLEGSENIISKNTSKNIGYLLFQSIYKDLGLNSFFNDLNKSYKATYNFNDVNRFLTYSRIIDACSKYRFCNNKEHYYEEPEIEYQHIERFLDVLYENYDSYLEKMYEGSNSVIKRNTSICYYDCTNFYSEIEEADDDYVDEVTGELIKGLRRYGHSKQHQPSPLVQMGLFMDKDGIPLTMSITPGNQNETLTAIPLEKKLLHQLKDKRLIYCADAGLGSLDIRLYNNFPNRGFIVTQSIKKMSDKLKKAVFNDYDYKLLSNDKSITIESLKNMDKTIKENLNLYNDKAYKVLDVDTLIDIGLEKEKIFKNGKKKKVKDKATFKQRVIITFSRKMMEFQRAIRNGQIERAKNLVESDSVTYLRKGPNDITRFIKKKSDIKDEFEIDQSVIDEEEKYDGYYAIATNLKDDAKDIIQVNSYRYKIEDCFRIMKTNFHSRPIYHRTREHIIAHFLICYTSLLIYRLLEVKLDRNKTHFTTTQIIDTIKNLNVIELNDLILKPIYTNSKLLEALEDIFKLDISKKYLIKNEIDKKVKKLLK